MNTSLKTPAAIDDAPHNDAATRERALQREARRRVGLKAGLLVHALAFTAVHLGLIGMHTLGGGWPGRPMVIWGWALGLAIHALVVTVRLLGGPFFTRQVAAEAERLRTRP